MEKAADDDGIARAAALSGAATLTTLDEEATDRSILGQPRRVTARKRTRQSDVCAREGEIESVFAAYSSSSCLDGPITRAEGEVTGHARVNRLNVALFPFSFDMTD